MAPTLTHLLEIVPFLLEAPGALRPGFSVLWSVLLAEEEMKSSPKSAAAPSFQHRLLMASWTNPSYLPRSGTFPATTPDPDPDLCLASAPYSKANIQRLWVTL